MSTPTHAPLVDVADAPSLTALARDLDRLLRPARAALLTEHGCTPAPVAAPGPGPGRPPQPVRQVHLCTPATPAAAEAARQADPDVWVADLEDGFVPHWSAQVTAHRTLQHWVAGSPGADRPGLMLRPRALHLDQPGLDAAGDPLPAQALPGAIGPVVDVVLHLGTCAAPLLARGRRPRVFVPKVGCADEARWWTRLLDAAEAGLGLEPGVVQVGVLVESVPCVLDLDGVLEAFGDRVDTVAAGRWDYVDSWLRHFGDRPDGVLPDLGALTMTTPLLRRFTESVLDGAARHGLRALGGPVGDLAVGRDGTVQARAQARVMRDKRREAREGFDGTWVSHPSHVAVARAAFASIAAEGPREPRSPSTAPVGRAALADPTGLVGQPSLAGLRAGVHQSLTYLSAWLAGEGRTLSRGRVEDLGTIEVLRRQLWGWHRHAVRLAEGPGMTEALVRRVIEEESQQVRRTAGANGWGDGVDAARSVLADAVLSADPPTHLSDALLPLLGRRGRERAADDAA